MDCQLAFPAGVGVPQSLVPPHSSSGSPSVPVHIPNKEMDPVSSRLLLCHIIIVCYFSLTSFKDLFVWKRNAIIAPQGTKWIDFKSSSFITGFFVSRASVHIVYQ